MTQKTPQLPTPSTPSIEKVEYYLNKWKTLDNYRLQESALNKLFFQLCPNNSDISDILLKTATLNDFYSTNIFAIYPVAKHIQSVCNLDERLKIGDVTLVSDIQKVIISGVKKIFTLLLPNIVAIIIPKIIQFMIVMWVKFFVILKKMTTLLCLKQKI